MIGIKKIDGNIFEVTVAEGSTTTHRVSLSDDYHKQLTKSQISKEDLIEKSFEFLLKRESNTMILSEFDLPVIQRYFPEYEKNIFQPPK